MQYQTKIYHILIQLENICFLCVNIGSILRLFIIRQFHFQPFNKFDFSKFSFHFLGCGFFVTKLRVVLTYNYLSTKLRFILNNNNSQKAHEILPHDDNFLLNDFFLFPKQNISS